MSKSKSWPYQFEKLVGTGLSIFAPKSRNRYDFYYAWAELEFELNPNIIIYYVIIKI